MHSARLQDLTGGSKADVKTGRSPVSPEGTTTEHRAALAGAGMQIPVYQYMHGASQTSRSVLGTRARFRKNLLGHPPQPTSKALAPSSSRSSRNCIQSPIHSCGPVSKNIGRIPLSVIGMVRSKRETQRVLMVRNLICTKQHQRLSPLHLAGQLHPAIGLVAERELAGRCNGTCC